MHPHFLLQENLDFTAAIVPTISTSQFHWQISYYWLIMLKEGNSDSIVMHAFVTE
jgi:hypothetical protein